MRFYIDSLFALPLNLQFPPFPSLPIELICYIFEIVAWQDFNTGLSLCLVSSDARRWIHPIIYETVELFGLGRMTDFASIFAKESLLATSVRNLSLYDDTPGDGIRHPTPLDHMLFPKILALCCGARRVAINYIRGIPPVEGPRPYELTIRRGTRGITLTSPPFEHVTHLHCRWEQLLPCFLETLATTRLTHVCFTHHLDFADETCKETVEFFLRVPQLQLLIVEVAYQRWHELQDPSVRRLLAHNTDERLIMRMSPYDTVGPYDEHRVFSGEGAQIKVWNVTKDLNWRTREWTEESILGAYTSLSGRSLAGIVSNHSQST